MKLLRVRSEQFFERAKHLSNPPGVWFQCSRWHVKVVAQVSTISHRPANRIPTVQALAELDALWSQILGKQPQ
jgi:hypothetical protein